MVHEWACCCDEAVSHQMPIAAALWIIWIVSTEECSSLTQNLMQIRGSTHSVTLNATATQYTCSLNGIYCPHWLVLWSRHCSHMCIPVPSLWLAARLHQWSANHSLYINNGWTFSRQTSYVITFGYFLLWACFVLIYLLHHPKEPWRVQERFFLHTITKWTLNESLFIFFYFLKS